MMMLITIMVTLMTAANETEHQDEDRVNTNYFFNFIPLFNSWMEIRQPQEQRCPVLPVYVVC